MSCCGACCSCGKRRIAAPVLPTSSICTNTQLDLIDGALLACDRILIILSPPSAAMDRTIARRGAKTCDGRSEEEEAESLGQAGGVERQGLGVWGSGMRMELCCVGLQSLIE